MHTSEDEFRFINFIDSMILEERIKLPPQWRREIINFTFRKSLDAPEQRLNNIELAKMLKDLLAELEIDYFR